MKMAMISLMLLGAAGAGLAASMDDKGVVPGAEAQTQERTDADRLYDLVLQARAELRATRVRAGLDATPAMRRAPRIESREGREGAGEHGGREGREGSGERGGSEHGGGARAGEEGSAYLPKMTRQDKLFANGARLALQFNPATQVFVGSVTNTTARTLSQVRVEIHLDNGTELGPTKRIDVAPGQTIPVELGTFGNEFSSWVSHPEAGVEQGHGGGGEEGGEGRGEHGGGEGRGGEEGGESHGAEGGEGGEGGGGEGGARPRDAAYKPVYNQLQILRGEMRAFEIELAARAR